MVAREFYLGAAVLSCMILGLIAEASYCPSCSAGGKDKHAALKACNKNVVDQVCDEDGPAVCEVVLNVFRSGRARVNRWCSTEGRHDEQNQQCKQNQKSGRQELNCSLLRAICTESGCNATLPEPVFKCPSCDALGNNEDDALKVCDDKAVDQGCLEQDPVCEATLTKTGAIVKVLRGCSTKKRYEAAKKKCLRAFVGCPQMAYCTESGCQATLPAMQKGERRDFLRAFYLAQMRKKAAEKKLHYPTSR